MTTQFIDEIEDDAFEEDTEETLLDEGAYDDETGLSMPDITCGYDDFLRVLVHLHGEQYLMRPDGELLEGVWNIPEGEPTHWREDRPLVYGRNAKMPEAVFASTILRVGILTSLLSAPKNIHMLVSSCPNLAQHQIERWLQRYKGKLVYRGDDGLWYANVGPEQIEPPTSVAVWRRAYDAIKARGPMTTRDLSKLLDVDHRALSASMAGRRDIFAHGGRATRGFVWTLREAVTID